MYVCTHVYIYMCVCVCVSVCDTLFVSPRVPSQGIRESIRFPPRHTFSSFHSYRHPTFSCYLDQWTNISLGSQARASASRLAQTSLERGLISTIWMTKRRMPHWLLSGARVCVYSRLCVCVCRCGCVAPGLFCSRICAEGIRFHSCPHTTFSCYGTLGPWINTSLGSQAHASASRLAQTLS